jgi:hypothetical protein
MGAKPVNIFECIVLAGKVAQQLLLLTWMDGFDKGTTLFTGANDEAKALCIALVVLGQGLNIAVYLSLGKNNVYYGTKLGAPVSWVTGFPYGTGFRHPQYVGGFVSQLGVLALSTDAEAPALAAWWGALYLGALGLRMACSATPHETRACPLPPHPASPSRLTP